MQIWEEGFKFTDLSILNFILFLKKSLRGFNFLVKLEKQSALQINIIITS